MVWAACAPPRHPQKTPSRGVRRDHGQGEAASEAHQPPHRLHQRHSHAPRPAAHPNPVTPPHAPIAGPSPMPMHSPTTAPTKLAGPLPAANKPHQTPQQLLAARGHVLRAAGASAAAEGSQQHQHQHQQALTRAPPLATFWTHTRPQTRLQAPPEPPVHAGSGGSRGGRRRSRCCCVFAYVAAAASRARKPFLGLSDGTTELLQPACAASAPRHVRWLPMIQRSCFARVIATFILLKSL